MVLSKENAVKIECTRRVNNLTVILNFTTICDACFKDSISVSSNEISICLANINPAVLCVCPYKDVFNFRLIGGGKYKINFYLVNCLGAEYHLAADTTIVI